MIGGDSGHSHTEKARLEAFMLAVPLDYCGFAADGAVAYNEGFCKILGLESIRALTDIQDALTPADAAVLEGMTQRLQDSGEPFSVTVKTANCQRILKLSGTRGQDQSESETLDILWLEDITESEQQRRKQEVNQEDIQEKRERLQAALDRLPMPLWIHDSHGTLVWCNQALAKYLGTSPATVIAEQREWNLKPVKKNAGTKVSIKTLVQSALDRGENISENFHVVLDGRRRLMRFTEMPLSTFSSALGMATDISREEELETVHKRHTAANNELLEHLGTAIAIYNADGQLEFFNSAFARLWDLDDSYLNTRPKLGDIMEKLREMRRLPEQADFRSFKQEWLGMFTRLLEPHEDMLYLPDATVLRMLAMPHPMGGLMMTFEDVSSRLELESSYNTLIAVQKETLDNLAESVAVFGGDGRLKLWNPSFARLWSLHPEGLDAEPHITRLVEKLKDNFEPDDWEKSRESLLKQSLDRKAREGHMVCRNGRLIAYATMPLPDGGVLVTHIDVTDTVQVENALREKNAALEAAEQLKSDFLANVSYQLRTPLSTIMGFTEILDNEYFGPLNDKQKEYTAGMNEAGGQLLSLIDNILDLSTIEAGYMSLERDNVAISHTLKALHELVTDWARKKKIEVTLDCPKNIGKAYLDERRLKQIILSLIRNAIDNTPEGGSITLAAHKDPNRLTITVSDTGIGISREDQDRVFKPFERLTKNGQNENQTGAGLGLTLVQNLVELHGGTIKLASKEGRGTTVTLSFPIEENKKTKEKAA